MLPDAFARRIIPSPVAPLDRKNANTSDPATCAPSRPRQFEEFIADLV